MDWLRDLEREDGPKGRIGFAISARMSDALQKAIDAVPQDQWQMLKEESDAIRSCAEVAFVPGERREKKDSQRLRYIAIRIKKKQGHLYDDGDAFEGGSSQFHGGCILIRTDACIIIHTTVELLDPMRRVI